MLVVFITVLQTQTAENCQACIERTVQLRSSAQQQKLELSEAQLILPPLRGQMTAEKYENDLKAKLLQTKRHSMLPQWLWSEGQKLAVYYTDVLGGTSQ